MLGVAEAVGAAAPALLRWAGLCVLVLALDVVYGRGGLPLPVAGALDAVSHLAATLVFLAGLAPRAARTFAAGALAITVAIDLDHVPYVLARHLGDTSVPNVWPLHNIVTVLAVLAVAWASGGRRRQAALGVAFGIVSHVVRDMGSDGAPLLAPLTTHRYELPYALYIAILAALAILAACRQGSLPRAAMARPEAA